MPIYKNFSFLDQFQDVEIDFTKYLEEFSDEVYNLEFSNNQPAVITIKNLFEQSDIVSDYKDRGASFVLHNIKEKELVEDIAIQYYGSEDFWWVICSFNGIQNPLTEWPMTDEQIHYIIDDILVTKEDKYSKEGYFKLLDNMNERRRSIEVLKRIQLPELIFQFRNAILTEPNKFGNQFTIRI